MNFKTRNEVITAASNLNAFYGTVINKIVDEMEEFEIRGSQWRLNSVLSLELRINKYNPLRGASYIPLPKTLANKNAIINLKNEDNKCFLWSILSALHPTDKNPQRVTKCKQWEHEFDEALNGIELPVKLTDVSKFAKRANMSISVFWFDNGRIAPLKITKEEKDKYIDLLYLTKKGKSHYCWIQNIGKLLWSQVTKYKEKIFPCEMCLNKFNSEEKLNDH
jgi:hypothetical protein